MKLLLDTHLLLWAAAGSGLSPATTGLINDPGNELFFSAASIWEVAIKTSLGRPDFAIDAGVFRRALLESGYKEMPITGAHAAAVATLPDLHKDPFDRILVAQAAVDGVTLLSVDQAVLAYPGPVQPAP
jgi:PIN domain nuclease of toxin-antitoxin system